MPAKRAATSRSSRKQEPERRSATERRRSVRRVKDEDAELVPKHPAAVEPGPEERHANPLDALGEVVPRLLRAQNAWLAQIDSLGSPDRKTHELIRMVCSVIARNPQGVRRHAMLAAEVGATLEEIFGSVVLAEPAFGILVVAEALPWAKRGWERGNALGDNEEPSDN